MGAIISVGVICYGIIGLALLTFWLISRKREPRTSVSSNTANIAEPIIMSQRQSSPFSLAEFRPATLRTTEAGVIITSALLAMTATACQEGFMRHSIELTCSEINRCHYEFRREILFNKVQATLCIQLRHQNASIGYIKVHRVSEHLECQKISHFWTKETYTQVQQVTRCRGMGSCYEDKCESLSPSEIVPELNSTAVYPGYSACSIQCSGINCVCPIPIRACTFYRVSHVPISSQVYEVFECAAWIPTINLNVDINFYKVKKHGQLSLRPYSTKEFGKFRFTVISTQIPQTELHQKFAQTSNETLLIPSHFVSAVICKTRHQAQSEFSSCNTAHFCECDVNGIKPSCRCPYDTFSELRRNNGNVLPLATPQIEINSAFGTVVAKTNEVETTVTVTSDSQFESAHLHEDKPCSIKVMKIRGCYSCRQGSTVGISCFARSDSWTTVTCADITFPIECGPNNKTTEVRIAFEKAIVDTTCRTTCGKRNITVKLSGILNYVSDSGESAVLLTNATRKIPQLDWFEDLRFPDLSPLKMVLIEHWKLTIAVASSFAILALLTYLFGPIFLLVLAKFTVSVTLLFINVACTLLKSSVSALLKGIHGARRLSNANRQA
ncbi:hypothetical protein OSTOST_14671 [Ostertagia ostertagi]